MAADKGKNSKKNGSRGHWKLVIFAVVAVALFVGFKFLNISERLRDLLEWIDAQGAWAPVIFILVYILACVFFVPGSILTLGAGVVFGVLWGSVYVSVGSTLGATAAFLIGRYLARETIQKKIAGNEKFSAIDSAVEDEGWKIVLLTRLSPIFPFNLLNYAFGLTKVKLHHYALASWVGMLPGTVMYVYIGLLAGNLATIGTEQRETSTGEWVIRIVGLVATIAVTLYVTKIARRALNKKVDADIEEEAEA